MKTYELKAAELLEVLGYKAMADEIKGGVMKTKPKTNKSSHTQYSPVNCPECKEETNINHTPTPWISEPINYDAYSAAIRIPDPLTSKSNGMGTIAHLPGTMAVKNAEFIVRAVNSHEKMLSALKDARMVIAAQNNGNMLVSIEEAIAQAEVKS